jgi:polyisoprenoid-binding protein YceI
MASSSFLRYAFVHRVIGASICLCILLCGFTRADASGFGFGINANKVMQLNNKVGENVINFKSEVPLERILGKATEISGGLTLNPDNLQTAQGEIIVNVLSMKTGIKKRDDHLYAPEWLDAAKFPVMTFKFTSLVNVKIISADANTGRGVAEAEAFGNFTMHGVTKQISIPVTITYVKESPKTREKASGDFVLIQAKFSVALRDFNVSGTKGQIGSKVGEKIDLEANLYAASK